MKRKDCRLCHGTKFTMVLNLGNSALANEFVDISINYQKQYPLKLYRCDSCYHFQLLDIVSQDVLFKKYLYVSGTSAIMRQHFRNYACKVISSINPNSNDLIVDIGSNDGTLLKEFQKHELNVVGVEPAENIAEKTNKEGIKTIPKFFNRVVAKEIINEFGKASIITCNNCFAHIDNLDEIILGVKELLKPDGIFILEFSYFLNVIKIKDFSQIYHEHLSYHTIDPLKAFFQNHNMSIIDIDYLNIHGGSIRLYIKTPYLQPMGEDFIKSDDSYINVEHIYCEKNIKSKLLKLKEKGKSIAGAYASAKSTTFLHYHDIGKDILDFIADDAGEKQGKFSPGKHIPILPFSAIYEKKPDYVIILSYNFADYITKTHRKYIDDGGTFIIPFPEYKEIK